jgi:hypothetical protein
MRDRPAVGVAPSHPAQPPGSPPTIDLADGARRFVGHWVAEGLMLCNLPFAARHAEALRRQGVRTVLNMCRDSEYRGDQREELSGAYDALEIVEHRLATSDGESPPGHLLDKAVDLFFGARRRGAVAVHCLGGRERSATIAAAIRTRLVGEPPEDAVDAIQAVAADVCPLPVQMRTLVEWAAVSP